MALRVAEDSANLQQVLSDLLTISQSPTLSVDLWSEVITDPDTGEQQVFRGTGYVFFNNNDPLQSSLGTDLLQQIINGPVDVIIRGVLPGYNIPNLGGEVLSLQCSAYTVRQPMIPRDEYTWLEIFYAPIRSLPLMYKTENGSFEPVRSDTELFHELAHVKADLDGATSGLDPIQANRASHAAAIALTNQYRATLAGQPPPRVVPDSAEGEEWTCGENTVTSDLQSNDTESVPGPGGSESEPDETDFIEGFPGGAPIGCFVATAAFDSPLHGSVESLRLFRDCWLLKKGAGRVLVRIYYRLGPLLAGAIRPSPLGRAAVRAILVPLVWMARWLARRETAPAAGGAPRPMPERGCHVRIG